MLSAPTRLARLKRSTPDRKSTRLNSSHRCISYAVFCLKKKKKYIVISKLTHPNSKRVLLFLQGRLHNPTLLLLSHSRVFQRHTSTHDESLTRMSLRVIC